MDNAGVNPLRPAESGTPGDRSAPVVADERELLDAERIGERENIVDELARLIFRDIGRPVRSSEAPLVGHDKPEPVLQPRRKLAPRAVRFRETMEQDHRRVRRIARKRDVQRHSSPERDAPELRHG